MAAELHKHWCILCLHDGSEDELIDVFSMSDLSDRIEEEYEICIKQNVLPVEICMPCLQETLNFRKQRRLYEADKERILKNQNHFRSQTPRGEELPSSAATISLDDALVFVPFKSSKSVTQHPKDSASKASDNSRIDSNSGGDGLSSESKQKGQGTIKLKLKIVPSANRATNVPESEKQTVGKTSKTTANPDKQGFISTNAIEGKKRVRFSIEKDTEKDSGPPPQKKMKYADSVEQADPSTTKKQGTHHEIEHRKSHSRDKPAPSNGQPEQHQHQKSSNAKNSSNTKRPSASVSEKTVAATAATNVGAVMAPAVVAGPNTATVPASTTAARATPDTGRPNESGQHKPSNPTKGGATNSAGPSSDVQNRSSGKVGGIVCQLRKPIPLSAFLMHNSPNTKGLKRIPKNVIDQQCAVKDNMQLGTLKTTPSSIVATGSRGSALATTKQSAGSIVVGPDASACSSTSNIAKTVVPPTRTSGHTNVLARPSNTSQVWATTASSSYDQNQQHSSNADGKTPGALEHGDTPSTSSGAGGTTCIPPPSNRTNDSVHLTAAGQLPTTSVRNAMTVGVTGDSNNTGMLDTSRQILTAASKRSPAVITVSESESICSWSSTTATFGSLEPSSTNTSSVMNVPVATAVPGVPRICSVITTTQTQPTVTLTLQPTITSAVFQPASSSLALATLQQQPTAPVATAARTGPGSQSATNGGIKKRRHSTFIRVNPNLFEEPDDQFASIRKNLLIRTAESTVSSLQMNSFLINSSSERPPSAADRQVAVTTVANTVPNQVGVAGSVINVSQVNRQQTTTVNINQRMIAGNSGAQPRTTTVDQTLSASNIPIHILYKTSNNGPPNHMANQILLPPVVQNGPGMLVASGPCSAAPGSSNTVGSFVRAPTGGHNQAPRLVQILPKPLGQGQAAPVVAVVANSNNSVRPPGTVGGGTGGGMSRGLVITPTGTIANTSSNQTQAPNVPSNSNYTQNSNNLAHQFPILMCQLCTEFFLSESSMAMHLGQVHYVEFSRSLYSTVYDESIWKLLVARARRKSIASPDDFRLSR